MRIGIAFCLSLAAGTAAACTPPVEPPDSGAQMAAWDAASRATLLARGDADSLFTAAVFEMGGSGLDVGQRLALLDRAAAIEPMAADIAAVSLAYCATTPGCDMAAHAARLAHAAPGDASALTSQLETAQAAGDRDGVTAVLERMAAQLQFNDYYRAIAARADRGLAALPPMPGSRDAVENQAMLEGYAYAIAAVAMPMRYGTLAKACKPDLGAYAERRAACGRIGVLLQGSDTIIGNMIGLRLAEWAADSAAERTAIQQQRRSIRWQMQNAYKDFDSCPDSNLAWLERRRAAGSERAALQGELVRKGIPLTPPADWRDPSEAVRDTAAAQH
ncbi:MAG TPA: hypothetical protein VFN09_15490 [Rhodanobacteraceae bacterium]|nr:hypothetical protein [Rhodanobacteraceae bacterium]